jgi:hypothetical protein
VAHGHLIEMARPGDSRTKSSGTKSSGGASTGNESRGGASTGGEGSRLDRELDELLQELRVLITCVTVLFGFLLTVSFSGQFARITGAERGLFIGAFFATAGCALLLVTPTVRHRARFRNRDKEALLESANRLTLAASVLLACALAAVTTLVAEHVYGWLVAIAAGAVFLGASAWLWFGWAILRRVTRDGDPAADPPSGLRQAEPELLGDRDAHRLHVRN